MKTRIRENSSAKDPENNEDSERPSPPKKSRSAEKERNSEHLEIAPPPPPLSVTPDPLLELKNYDGNNDLELEMLLTILTWFSKYLTSLEDSSEKDQTLVFFKRMVTPLYCAEMYDEESYRIFRRKQRISTDTRG